MPLFPRVGVIRAGRMNVTTRLLASSTKHVCVWGDPDDLTAPPLDRRPANESQSIRNEVGSVQGGGGGGGGGQSIRSFSDASFVLSD